MVAPLLFLAMAAVPLHAGDLFPPFSGQTVAGRAVALPIAGKLQAVIFSFSRAGGNDARRWNEQISKEIEAHRMDESYLIILLEAAPRLLRGMIAGGIKAGMPTVVREHTFIAYKDETMWKQRLAVSRDDRAYVALLDRSGRVAWTNAGLFTEADFQKLQTELSHLGALR